MRSLPAARAGRAFTAFLVVACAVLAVQVLVLSGRNRALRAQLDATPDAEPAERPRLEIGDLLPPFHVNAADGSVVRVDFDAWATLLLVFAERCPACPLVFPDWEELLGPFEEASVPVLGLRLDPPAADGAGAPSEHSFPVHTLADAREVPLAEMATVPLTVLLDDAGRVLWCRYGPLTDEHRAELLSYLGEPVAAEGGPR